MNACAGERVSHPEAEPMLTDEVRYKLFTLLEASPELSQRGVARELGISLGKVNYCLRGLVDKGWIKAANFKNSKNKVGYLYLLTPRGIEEKARVTTRFLRFKLREYEMLKCEIEEIRNEVNRLARRQTAQSSRTE
jgi:EPS-associated MarR family transcriptional regulator